MKNSIKAFKGFTRQMKCRDFQYEVGGEFKHNGEVSICESGFHACENPIDCLRYYSPNESVYHEVEMSGQIQQNDEDSKIASSRIKIGARLDIAGLCRATFEYVKSKCTYENNANPGKSATAGDRGAATAGECGAATAGDYGAATAGYYGAATAGNYGAATAGECGAATAGYYGAATAGYYGAATAGECGAATAGYRGAATAGDRGAATAGECGAATSRGSSSSGTNGLSVARGTNVKVRGGLGAILVIAEEKTDNDEIKDWKAVVVDGVNIKVDTWYKLENGALVAVETDND